MSYIRPSTNPEQLYIWHDIDGNVYFTWFDHKRRKHTVASRHRPGVRYKDFSAFMNAMLKRSVCCEPFTKGPLSIRDVYYDVVRHRKIHSTEDISDYHPNVHFHIELSFTPVGKKRVVIIYMWEVTWESILDSFRRQKSKKSLLKEKNRTACAAKTKTKKKEKQDGRQH